jgi:hypothetical protein
MKHYVGLDVSMKETSISFGQKIKTVGKACSYPMLA